MTAFDRRITPARDDLAADTLRGVVAAPRYASPTPYEMADATVALRARPEFTAPRDTEALFGERVQIFDISEGWAWGQLQADGYVGYLPAVALRPAGRPATHALRAIRSFVYAEPSIKSPVLLPLSLGSEIAVQAVEGAFARIEEGFIWAGHLRPLSEPESDFVAVAERFLHAPYLWGGRSGLGLDCSALMQLALGAAGIPFPRDSDLQAASAEAMAAGAEPGPLGRGDLVFWKGHVGVMTDARTLLHATGFTMTVIREPLETTRSRIRAGGYGPVIAVRRAGTLVSAAA